MLPELHTPIPGPRSLSLAARLHRAESRNVTFTSPEWPIFWERAHGVNVWDADGNRYLDLTSAFGVASLGHGATAAAMTAQAVQLVHAMGDVHPTEAKAELCEQLSAVTFQRWKRGPAKVILGNSGSDAVEAALKTALLHTGKPGVIVFRGGYHGLGLGALAAGGLPFFQAPFRPQLADLAVVLPFPASPADLQRAISEKEIGAVLVEPLQGRGGCVLPPPDFLPMLRAFCDTHGLLLIADEILTGFHRTGPLFGCDHTATIPDLICLGKALTGGFPLSACVGPQQIMDAWPETHGEALHTSTFLGHPVGCAMALASIKAHADPAVRIAVQEKSAHLTSALRRITHHEIRGMGLMLGIALVKADGQPDTERAISIIQRALRAGIIMLADGPASHILSLLPPFTITDEELDYVVEWLGREL